MNSIMSLMNRVQEMNDLMMLVHLIIIFALCALILSSFRDRIASFSWFLSVLIAQVILNGWIYGGPAHASRYVLSIFAVFVFSVTIVLPGLLMRICPYLFHIGKYRGALFCFDLVRSLQPGRPLAKDRGRLHDAILAMTDGQEHLIKDLQTRLDRGNMSSKEKCFLIERILNALILSRKWLLAGDIVEKHRLKHDPKLSAAIGSNVVRVCCELGAFRDAGSVQAQLEGMKVSRNDDILRSISRIVLLSHIGDVESVQLALTRNSDWIRYIDPVQRQYLFELAVVRSGKLSHEEDSTQDRAKAYDPEAFVPSDLQEAALMRGSMPYRLLRQGLNRSIAMASTQNAPSSANPPSGVSNSLHATRTLLPQIPLLTVLLIGINLVLFAVQLIYQRDVGESRSGYLLGANWGVLTLHGEPWRLICSMFLHGGYMHLGFNMYALWTLGRSLEQIIGHFRFTLVYLLSGILGAVASALWHPNSFSLGASGAILGLVGGFFVVLFSGNGAFISVSENQRKQGLRSMATMLVLQAVIGLQVPNIDNAAHVGGLLGGVAIMYVLLWERRYVDIVERFKNRLSRGNSTDIRLDRQDMGPRLNSGAFASFALGGIGIISAVLVAFYVGNQMTLAGSLDRLGVRQQTYQSSSFIVPVTWKESKPGVFFDPLQELGPTLRIFEKIGQVGADDSEGEWVMISSMIMEEIRKTPGLRTIKVLGEQQMLTKDIARVVHRIVIDDNSVDQFDYFIKTGNDIAYIRCRVGPRDHAAYSKTFDKVVYSIIRGLTGNSAPGELDS